MSGRALAAAIVGLGCCLAGGARAQSACPESDPTAVAEPDRACVAIKTRPPEAQSLVPDLSVLKSPEAPAFAALELSPTAIARPGTPTGAAVALAAGLANGIVNPGGNVAIDIAPYWLFAHPRLTASEVEKEWYRIDRRASLSFASTTTKLPLPDAAGVPVDTDVGRVSIGAHAALYPGKASQAARACGRVVDDYMAGDVAAIAEALPAFVAAWIAAHPRPVAVEIPQPVKPRDDSPEEKDRYADEVKTFSDRKEAANAGFAAKIAQWSNEQLAAIDGWRKERAQRPGPEVLGCLDVIHHRTGLMVDAAFAEILSFPGNDIRNLDSNGSRDELLWLTGGYTVSWGATRKAVKPAYDLSVLGLLKYDWKHVANADAPNRVQGGARIVLAVERWGVSVEGLLSRTTLAGAGTNAYRVSATIDYHLKTGFWVTLTGGADLDADGAPTVPIALASFQANFGRDRLLAPDTTTSQPAPKGAPTP